MTKKDWADHQAAELLQKLDVEEDVEKKLTLLAQALRQAYMAASPRDAVDM